MQNWKWFIQSKDLFKTIKLNHYKRSIEPKHTRKKKKNLKRVIIFVVENLQGEEITETFGASSDTKPMIMMKM